jgi:chaperonin GroEL
MKEINYEKEHIINGVNKLSEAVLKTMGPNGKTMILIDDFGKAKATKDGVSVAEYIFFKNPFENGVADLVKQAAQQTVKEAGDGTTTSICLTQAFILKGFELLEKGYKITDLQKELDSLYEKTIDYLENNKHELVDEDIIHVAKISANNDEKIAKIITDAYTHSTNVKVEETKNGETTVEKIKGIKLNTSYFDNAFINNMSKQSIEYNGDMSVILVDGNLTNLENIKHIIKDLTSVTIIADHYSKSVLNTLKYSYNNGTEIVPLKSPGVAGHRRNIMKDLSKYFGIKLIDPLVKIKFTEDIRNYIGTLDSIYVDKSKAILHSHSIGEEFGDYFDQLEDAFLYEEDDNSKDLLEQRIENLSGSMSIIKVGGSSDLEIKEKKDRIDDAVLAVKCAIEEGVVEGGGLALAKSSEQMKNLFSRCLANPYVIISTSTNVKFDTTKEVIDDKLLDPVKVTKTALKNAISVSKVLLSAEGAVLSPRLWS